MVFCKGLVWQWYYEKKAQVLQVALTKYFNTRMTKKNDHILRLVQKRLTQWQFTDGMSIIISCCFSIHVQFDSLSQKRLYVAEANYARLKSKSVMLSALAWLMCPHSSAHNFLANYDWNIVWIPNWSIFCVVYKNSKIHWSESSDLLSLLWD